MKKLLCILTAAVTLTAYSAFPIQPVQAADDMSKTAQEIVDDIIIGWNLGNTFEEFKAEISDDPYFYETSCAQPITTKKMILDVKEAGFNAIRLPVTWYQKLDENNNISEAWMNRIQEVVDYAYDEGMYVIINIHHDTNHGWIQADYDSWDTYQNRYAAIWTQIADRFKDYDYHLIFEGHNEIIRKGINASGTEESIWGFWYDWQQPYREEAIEVAAKFNQLFVDTVRSTEGNNAERVLICNTYAASGDANVIHDFELPTDTVEDKLITGVHCYLPYNFTHGTDENNTYSSAELQSVFNTLDTYLDGPVIMGEFGALNKDNDEERIRYYNEYVTTALEKGIKCFIWDTNSTQMGGYNRNIGAWREPEVTGAMLEAAGVKDVYLKPEPDYSGSDNLAADPFAFSSWANNQGSATITENTEDHVTLTVLNGGNKAGDVMLNYDLWEENMQFEEGKKYRISFDIVCEGIDEINGATLNIGYTTSDYSTDIIDHVEELTVTSQKTHTELYYTPTMTYDGAFYFYLQSGNNEAYTVTLSDLQVFEVKESGDVNDDGEFTVADVVTLQKWLLGASDVTLSNWQTADLCKDDQLDVFDLCLMKRELVKVI